MRQENTPLIRTVSAGEAVYTEGYAGNPCIYVIMEGRVEISTRYDDKRVVLTILGKDDCFGETALAPSEPRGSSATALSFCRLIVVIPDILDAELERVSPLLRHVMRSLIRKTKRADDLLLTHTNADLFYGIVCYAHVLALMAQAQGHDVDSEVAVIPFDDVFARCQAITGHPRMQVIVMLQRMETLNLIESETASVSLIDDAAIFGADAKQRIVSFNPVEIVDAAQRVADQGLGMSVVRELELTGRSSANALIGIDKQLLLDRMARGEQGVGRDPKKTTRSTQAFASLADVEIIDDRTLFDTVDAFAAADLARLLLSGISHAVSDRLVSVMTRARRAEVSKIIQSDPVVDAVEAQNIHRRFIHLLKAALLKTQWVMRLSGHAR